MILKFVIFEIQSWYKMSVFFGFDFHNTWRGSKKLGMKRCVIN